MSDSSLDNVTSIKSDLAPTPVNTSLPQETDGFSSLLDALEYAAGGDSGFNFYGHRGELKDVLSYRDLRRQARELAARLQGLGCNRGDRVGIIAETGPMFHRFFFACQYAGLIPVALPAGVQLGARDAFVEQIRRMLESCGARIAVAPPSHAEFLQLATAGMDLAMAGTEDEFDSLPACGEPLEPATGDDIAYLQYTSGSTSFPRGVEISHATALNNIRSIARHGLKMTVRDRFVSWLPYYHDMGLIGFILLPTVTQTSVDYLSPHVFAMRPRLWLKLISDNRGTISSSPTFGYALCARRLKPSDYEKYDLGSWRAACVGAEQINPLPLREFAKALAPCGFDQKAFVACYGMAECVLAVSFAPLELGLGVDCVDQDVMAEHGEALPVGGDGAKTAFYANCGIPLPDFEVSIRDANNTEAGERVCGEIYLRGPSVMSGYFHNREATQTVLDSDGWLRTGDIGYMADGGIHITARSKDVIIVKGRNIWPCDLEAAALSVEGVRLGGVAAFSVDGEDGQEQTVMVVESRLRNPVQRSQLEHSISQRVHTHFGINVAIDLVRPGSLPRTTSGKLSRVQSRHDYLLRQQAAGLQNGVHAGRVRKIA